MTYTQVVILALVQGVTEFLPVSSSGHLLVARSFIHIPDVGGLAFDATLHIGTLIAVFVYYWRTWWDMFLSIFDATRQESRRLLGYIIVATIPAGIVGFLAEDAVEAYFRSPHIVGFLFLVTAFILYLAQVKGNGTQEGMPNFRQSLVIGCAQVIALLPGISRSGMTIAAGVAQNIVPKTAADFSFLLSAPIIFGAGLSSFTSLLGAHEFPLLQLVLGIVVACISGLIAIHFLLKIVRRFSVLPFVIYLIGIGIVTLLFT